MRLLHFRFLLILMLTASSFCCAAGGQRGPDILGIFDQMVISRMAAELCSPPTSENQRLFEANFNIVSIRAKEEVKRRSPSKTDQDVLELVKGREHAIASRVKDYVTTKGCQEKDIVLLVRRFGMQAKWDMRK